MLSSLLALLESLGLSEAATAVVGMCRRRTDDENREVARGGVVARVANFVHEISTDCTIAGLALEAAAETSHHACAPKERILPPVRRSSIGPKPTTSSAARRARPASLGAAPSPQRQLKPWRVRLLLTRQPASRWRRQLKRRTTAARQGQNPFAGVALFHTA